MSEEANKTDFETMLSSLEKIVGQLEGELKLEEAMALFEQGLTLSQNCEQFLKHAENKIEILRRTASGIQIDTINESELLVTT
jgi:exodeoxyribonuclease VII small subunit